jgi:UDP-glucose 4-epimerase
VEGVKQITGDRTDASGLKEKLASESFDAVFDNNGRELSDTQPLAEIFKDKVQHFVYMSSAGVYLKTTNFPTLKAMLLTRKAVTKVSMKQRHT